MIKEYKDFINDYMKLVKKHGVYIKACGCCNSPWVTHIINKDHINSIREHLINPKAKNMHSG